MALLSPVVMTLVGSVWQISVDTVDTGLWTVDISQYQDKLITSNHPRTVNIDFAGWAGTGSVTTYSPANIQTRAVDFIQIFIKFILV